MTPEFIKIYALLLSLLGPAPRGEYDVNMPDKLILKPGQPIIAIGDSITHAGGYLKDVERVLAALYPELKLPPIHNEGAPGQKAEDLVQRFHKDVVARKPAVVLISVGINDVGQRALKPHQPQVLADYWTNIDKMVDMAQSAGIQVILMTPTMMSEDPAHASNQRLRIYVEAEKQVARERHCTLVDLHAMFMTVVVKRPKGLRDGQTWLTWEGVHMNGTGDTLMAIGVLRALGVPEEKMASLPKITH
jgi:lysophospholipase L1-like esterase